MNRAAFRRVQNILFRIESMNCAEHTRKLLDMVYRTGAPRFSDLDPLQARRSFEKLHHAFGFERMPVASVVDVPIRRTDGTVLICRAYRPLASGDEVLPLTIYYHGGGWCLGNVDTHDGLCRHLANRAHHVVLSVDYRLAPEHPFPAAVEDARLAYRWALDEAAVLGADMDRIFLAGDSAGATLSIVTALLAADAGWPKPKALRLIYPCVSLESERPSRKRFREGFFLDESSLQWFFERYLSGAQDAADWRASPLLRADLSSLPPVALLLAGMDPLTDDCLAFAEQLQKQQVAVRTYIVPGVIHGFFSLGKWFPESAEGVAWLCDEAAR
jgi:acetyl esterase